MPDAPIGIEESPRQFADILRGQDSAKTSISPPRARLTGLNKDGVTEDRLRSPIHDNPGVSSGY